MYPKLFELPFLHLTVWTYGLMMVIGFLAAVSLIRRLSRNITPDPQMITNAALYSLIAGVLGGRLFYVLHHFDQFRGNLLSAFAIWNGGLELLGGVIPTIIVIVLYLRHHKLPVRRYLDILAIALLLALAFGRVGCFMRGCCFGKPTDAAWAVSFPYGSHAYYSQIYENPKRNRPHPQLELPGEYFGNYQQGGETYYGLKPLESLTELQKISVTRGVYRCLPVHPTQLYSSAVALFSCLLLYFFRRRSMKASRQKKKKLFAKPGCTFGLMVVLYGAARPFLEYLRDDNPFEYAWWALYRGGTVSQNLGIYMVIIGVILMIIFERAKPEAKI